MRGQTGSAPAEDRDFFGFQLVDTCPVSNRAAEAGGF